ncbi:MAG: hypothetical protein Q8P20_00365 [bacterium]|nr:hypothetical protein [bacterium]
MALYNIKYMNIDDILKSAFYFEKLAEVRNKGDVVFSADGPSVTDGKDHFPINTLQQARNALARASQYDSSPPWYNGSLTSLLAKIRKAVKTKYPSIELTEKSKKPGRG